jgi:hypothetical protein
MNACLCILFYNSYQLCRQVAQYENGKRQHGSGNCPDPMHISETGCTMKELMKEHQGDC